MYGSRGAKQDGQIDKVCVCKRDSTGEGWLTGGGVGVSVKKRKWNNRGGVEDETRSKWQRNDEGNREEGRNEPRASALCSQSGRLFQARPETLLLRLFSTNGRSFSHPKHAFCGWKRECEIFIFTQ